MNLRTLSLACFAFGPIVLAGCTDKVDVASSAYVDDTEPADKLYNEALANVDAGNLKEARAKFQKVDRQHPYSVHGRKAMVMTTYLAYKQGEWTDAITSGQRFVQLFPSDSDAAYMQYLVGMSYHRQIVDVTRDQRSARKSIEAMNAVIERYPESEYVDDAKVKIRTARDQLAGKHMLTGRYYQERREHLAAINRFRKVVEEYSNTRHVEEALYRLTESYLSLGLQSEAQTAAAVLGHNFPDSEWYRDAYALLGKGGLRPEENSGSWIARAAKAIVGVPA